MNRVLRLGLALCLATLGTDGLGQGPAAQDDASRQAAEERAVVYLAREVPLWSRENGCFSCHNNGDGARALYAAHRLSHSVAANALRETTEWLRRPRAWDRNRGDPEFSDKKLARIQFAASLVEAFEAGLVTDRDALVQAAQSLLPDQQADGSWQVDAEASVGSPVTYGAPLATYAARRTLETADSARFREPIARANRWLVEANVNATPDAAAVLMALADRKDPEARSKVRQALERIEQGQGSDGGWGPYLRSPSEPFDTAVALLALVSIGQRQGTARWIERGREYLVSTQLPSGGWPETTRPPGGQSYAQHISTSGWATLALLESAHAQALY